MKKPLFITTRSFHVSVMLQWGLGLGIVSTLIGLKSSIWIIPLGLIFPIYVLEMFDDSISFYSDYFSKGMKYLKWNKHFYTDIQEIQPLSYDEDYCYLEIHLLDGQTISSSSMTMTEYEAFLEKVIVPYQLESKLKELKRQESDNSYQEEVVEN